MRAEGAPPRGAGAEPPPFLDSIETNRNNGRKSYCGRFSLRGDFPLESLRCYTRLYCKTWDCESCGPRKAARYQAAIRQLAEDNRLNRFVTLTLDPRRIKGDPFRHLRRTFDKFRTYLRRRHGKVQYIAVLELQSNGTLVFQSQRGTPLSDTNLLHRHLKPAGGRLGVPWLNWHTLRRTHATLFQLAGGSLREAQAQLGHARMSTTLEIYTLPLAAAQRQAVEKLAVLVTNSDESAQTGERFSPQALSIQ